MKKPNDIKRPNSNSGSLGQTYRRRERLIHVSKSFVRREHRDDDTGVVQVIYTLDHDNSKFTRINPERLTPTKTALQAKAVL